MNDNKLIKKLCAGLKNETVKEIINSNGSKSPNGDPQKNGYSFVGGYIYSLIETVSSPDIGIDIDLSYSTVKELVQAAAVEFFIGNAPGSRYSTETNIEIAEKTIASYLICLAMNEENAGIVVSFAADISPDAVFAPNRWSGLESVSRGVLVSVDFLKEIHNSVTFENDVLTVDMEKSIGAYRTLTGKDLRKYGVKSCQFGVDRK